MMTNNSGNMVVMILSSRPMGHVDDEIKALEAEIAAPPGPPASSCRLPH